MDEAWAKFHATSPDVERVDIAVSIRPDLLTGNPSQPGDQVVDLARRDFLKHAAGCGEQLGRNPLGTGKLGCAIRGAAEVHGRFDVVWQATARRDDGHYRGLHAAYL